eukprot:gene1458-biopygen8833
MKKAIKAEEAAEQAQAELQELKKPMMCF